MNYDRMRCVFIVIGIYTSYWMEEIRATRFQLDWVGSIQMGLTFCLGPFAARLIRKYGCKLTTVAGGFLCGGGFLLCVFTVHLSMLYIFYGILTGIGFGLAYMSAVVAVTLSFVERRPIAMGFVTCGTGAGCSLFSVAIPLILEKMDWRKSMYVLAAITVNLCFYGCLLLPGREVRDGRRATNVQTTVPQNVPMDQALEREVRLPSQLMTSTFALYSTWEVREVEKRKILNNLLGNMGSYAFMNELDRLFPAGLQQKKGRLHLFKEFTFVTLLITSFLISFTFMPPILYLFDRLRQKQIHESLISAVLSGYGIAGAITRLFVGVTSSFTWCNKSVYMFFWVTVSAVSTILTIYMKNASHFGAYACVLGGASGAFIVLQPLVLAEMVPSEDLTDALGIILLASGMGYMLGTPAMALVYDNWQSYDVCYLACGALVGAAAINIAILAMVDIKKILMRKYEQQLKRRIEADMQQCRDDRTESSQSS
ncbi:unnamed protein product [Dicrocoelium dendriticum]|nr:unnamed protein product [Dicrocoelium dendriticum]